MFDSTIGHLTLSSPEKYELASILSGGATC